MLLGLVLPTTRRGRAARRADAARRPAGAAAGRRADRGPGRTTGTCPAGRTSRCSTPSGPRRRRGGPGGSGSTRCSSRSGWPGSAAGRSRPTRSACGSGSGWPGRCCAAPSCWCSTSRPTAWTRRASREIRELLLELHRGGTTVFLSSHLLAEVEQLCTRVGVLDRGRLVLQDAAGHADRARPARPWCTPPAPDRVRATLDGRVTLDRRRAASSSAAATRPRSTRCWSAPGVPVTGLGAGAADAGGGRARRRRHQHRPGGGADPP